MLLFVIHHAVGDQWSGGVLAREMAAAYDAALHGIAPRIGRRCACSTPTTAVAARAARREALDAELAYWRARLPGTPTLAAARSMLPRADVSSARAARCEPGAAELAGQRRSIACVAWARPTAPRPFMVLLAAFKLLLARYCDQDDIAVGTPIANRTARRHRGSGRHDGQHAGDAHGFVAATRASSSCSAASRRPRCKLMRTRICPTNAWSTRCGQQWRRAVTCARARAVQCAERALGATRIWAATESHLSSSIVAQPSSTYRSRSILSTSIACISKSRRGVRTRLAHDAAAGIALPASAAASRCAARGAWCR